MSISKQLAKLSKIEESLSEISRDLVEEFKKAPKVLTLAEELNTVVEALAEFKLNLEGAVERAKLEVQLIEDLLGQIAKTDYLKELSDKHKADLAEYLVSKDIPLWTKEEYIAALVEVHSKHTDEELIASFPKTFISDMGRAVQRTEEDKAKTQYLVGLEALKAGLKQPAARNEIVKEHVENLVEKAPLQALKSLIYEKEEML